MKPDYVDIHGHLNFAAFDEDRERIVAETLAEKVWAISVGTQRDTSRSAVVLARQYEGLFATVGLHPIHTAKSFHDKNELGEGGDEFTSRGEEFDMSYYRDLAQDPKVVAIGECGLDYFRLEEASSKERQIEIFLAQIALAREVGKPLMLHIRNAYADAYDILKSQGMKGNLHFFVGSQEDAKRFLDLGCTFSFTGVVTFARDYDEVINYIPLDRMMAETDAPYVSPEPHRGKRNEPRFVSYVVERIAHIKNLPLEQVRLAILENVRQTFNIPV